MLLPVASLGMGQQVRPLIKDVPPIIQNFARFMRMGKATGVRRIELGNDSKVLREIVTKDGERLRTTYPNESPLHGRIVVENRRVRRAYDPTTNEITVTELHPNNQDTRLINFVRRGMKLDVTDGERVAGRPTQVVSVSDPQGRTQLKIWLDTRTGFPLKKITYNGLGQAQGSFEYESVNYSPQSIESTDFELNIPNAKVVTPLDISRRIAERLGLKPLYLPKPQFLMQSCHKQSGPYGDFLVQVYEGEAGRVTLFQSPRILRFKVPGNREAVVWSQDGQTFAMMGLPKKVLERLARSLGKPD